jgi:predicted TIM-barrel fold metal-dependent hydrolase
MATDTVREAKEARAAKSAIRFVDCDVHNALPSNETLRKYIPQKWHKDISTGGKQWLGGGRAVSGLYPSRPQKGTYRWDARPPSGGLPGSDYDFMLADFFDMWSVDKAILAPLDGNGWPQSGAFSGALSTALNDWMVDQWLGRDPRMYGAITIPTEDAILAAQEIRRCAEHRRFVQVLMFSRTRDPMGHRRYWPIYEAAAEVGLPVAVHVGGGGNPVLGAGWPSYHFEYHAAYVHSFQTNVMSLISSGVFDAIPSLKIVMEEGGFAWAGPLAWRMDRAWRLMGKDVTHMERKPSEVMRSHLWFTTQPIDEAEKPEHFLEMLHHLDHIGMADRVMFSTDYPHWDFDSPEKAFPAIVSGELKERIFRGNANALYRFEPDAKVA